MEQVTITLVKVGKSKLEAVKALKHGTGLGLKEAKDLFDSFGVSEKSMSRTIRVESVQLLKKELLDPSMDYVFRIDDVQRKRRDTFIELGLGDDSDKMELLSEKLADKFYCNLRGVNIDEYTIIKDGLFEILFDIEDMSVVDKLLKIVKEKEKKNG
jgi:hypothetical protein